MYALSCIKRNYLLYDTRYQFQCIVSSELRHIKKHVSPGNDSNFSGVKPASHPGIEYVEQALKTAG